MEIRYGWSGEIAANQWVKFDVLLDRLDLQQMLTDAMVPVDTLVPLNVQFQLLSSAAEKYSAIHQLSSYPEAFPGAREEAQKHIKKINELLEGVRPKTGKH